MEPLGIGSNLTAELCGLRLALGEILSFVSRYNRVFLFCDCVVAVELASSRVEPTSDFTIVKEIRDLVIQVQEHTELLIKWVPAHVRVAGNEVANTAAQRGADMVQVAARMKNQPLVPFKAACAVLRQGIRERRQEQWLRIGVEKVLDEHLFRIKPDVARQAVYFKGNRAQQTTLARLRLGHNLLASSQSRWNLFHSPNCECKLARETVRHYLLQCPLYECERACLMNSISQVYEGLVTEEVLLGANLKGVSQEQSIEIAHAVYQFVVDTRKEV